MIQRYAVSLLSGMLITFALLWVMQVLIATGKRAITDEADINLGDFIRVKKEEVVRTDEDEPEKPPEVKSGTRVTIELQAKFGQGTLVTGKPLVRVRFPFGPGNVCNRAVSLIKECPGCHVTAMLVIETDALACHAFDVAI